MLTNRLAIVADTEQVTGSQLSRVAAALQSQAITDFRATWNVTATIDAFDKLEDIPPGYWPIIVRDDIHEPGAAGVHLDKNGQPFALIQYSDSWSLTASHEMLEMLADPWGNRLVTGQSPKSDQGQVQLLVEVCDPPEDPKFGYTINGLLVSDFITPNFYDPVMTQGVRYSFGGNITTPRTIVSGGYMSWHDPVSDHWWQQTWFDSPKPQFRDLGVLTARTGSVRSAVDARTGTSLRIAEAGPQAPSFSHAHTLTAQVKDASASRAQVWRAQIDRLRAGELTEATWEGGEAIYP